MNKKEKLLNKYLNKKSKQKLRDELYAELMKFKEPEEKIEIKIKKNKTKSESKKIDNKINNKVDNKKDNNMNEKIDNKMNENIDNEMNENENIDNKLLIKREVKFCNNRIPEIQSQRETLPIYFEEDRIMSSIRAHQVIIISGSTGCGKTTQIPQFLYEHGYCNEKRIVVTQPRRISAITNTWRINTETNENLAGYKIKYESTVTEDTRIKIVTDGVLLKEIRKDFLLSEYSVILVDEYHERSVNIDILVALLSRVCRLRPELRVIIMSATIETGDLDGLWGHKIPVIDIEGVNHRIDLFYGGDNMLGDVSSMKERPNDKYLEQAEKKIKKIIKENSKGTILCFLPGKEDIHELGKMLKSPNLKILPFHASLTSEDQKLIFKPTKKWKIILATNIAETSITIPDVSYVVDTGRMKVKTYEDGVLCYKVAFIAKSNAIQRMGRAGRTKNGICYRLYSGVTYDSFLDYPIPRILTDPLDEHFLMLKSMGIDIKTFPFLTHPGVKRIDDTCRLLVDLGALDNSLNITSTGLDMVLIPLPPRLSRLITARPSQGVIALASIISVNLEIKTKILDKEITTRAMSDTIVKLRLFNRYILSDDKPLFCKTHHINYNLMEEALKIYKHLLKGMSCEFVLDDEVEKELRNIIYCGYCDQLATKMGNVWVYNGRQIWLASESVKEDENYLVFEYLISGKKKTYAKNITYVDEDFFN
ncbi:putative pre-mRNA-splicing factor ATP-dependent RNA helicase DEAH6 [Astathelohania contejeani]|uniref:Pre-mRNA-splicing factor ATP-dependent RNA helicase DEAH6 n=1 Tax=Astathelohania contejeani TaxID=164912 RepID=A0ABQ7HYC5_9MICR|nr:putative pre-mRNA-splicing factor ATP-dependent RNA helicase DEAH6 [Thelohania contejeani]